MDMDSHYARVCYNELMGKQIKTKGIVLHEMPIGDYDKRLIILTKEQGKVTAFVKGARRANSKMLAMTQVFAYGEFVLSQGRSSYNVYQAQLIEAFHHLRSDMEEMTIGMYMLEFVDYVAREEEENVMLMHWLLISLLALDRKRIKTSLAIRIFELRAMSIIGFTPWLTKCVECHKESFYFSAQAGGTLCKVHGQLATDRIQTTDATVYAMNYILSQPLKEVYRFELADRELYEFERIMTRFVDYNLNHTFKTMEFLRTL